MGAAAVLESVGRATRSSLEGVGTAAAFVADTGRAAPDARTWLPEPMKQARRLGVDTWLHGDGSTAFIDSIVRNGVPKPKQSAAPMPPMGGAHLSDEQVKAVVGYVQSLRRS